MVHGTDMYLVVDDWRIWWEKRKVFGFGIMCVFRGFDVDQR